MSIINGTIVVQAINFFFAFFLIKYFFFKPAVAHMHADDALQESLINTIQKHQLIIANKERLTKEHWDTMHAYFASGKPDLTYTYQTPQMPSIKIPELDNQTLLDATNTLANQLIEKVQHVRD